MKIQKNLKRGVVVKPGLTGEPRHHYSRDPFPLTPTLSPRRGGTSGHHHLIAPALTWCVRTWHHLLGERGGVRFKVQGSRFKVQGSRFKVQGLASSVQE